ncbi:kelch-like protein 6 [Tetranychus urticae]|uniref:kelch-like protein 6 n=1 Tax=Tetranychus urticae TaxID=32264 RepID=UPI000D641DA1|nr:kelch-like protein 6 [Tetranychus urticae]
MDQEDENCDTKLQIVNRKRKYNVSKKFICSSVPYFEKMFSCDSSDSKKKKFEMDFDEHAFDALLDWIHSGFFFIQMNYVIDFYEAADYLMIKDSLLKLCLSYFHDNLTIEHLPAVLKQVTKLSKLINSGSIENLICRHFLMITNTGIYLDYPVEIIEAILKLDLMVYSEYQVFESIMKWVNYGVDARKALLPQLLNCVRWSYMDPNDIFKIKDDAFIKTLQNLDFVKSSSVEFKRTNQNFFISIHQADTPKLRIRAFDNEFFCFTIGNFSQDDSMSLEFVHGEHISDILFDSGTKGIRIDWLKQTFRWLDFKVAGKTYYSKLMKFFVEFRVDDTDCYLEDKEAKLPDSITAEESLILESNGKFIVVGKTKDEKKWFGLFPVKRPNWFNNFEDHEHSFQATVLDDVVYILTKNLEFIQFNIKTRSFDKSEPFKEHEFNFDDLILTSQQTKDDKVILVNKSTGKVYSFCINQKEWIEKCCIMNGNFCFDSSCASVDKLISFTSAFLPIKNIYPLYEHSAA